MNHAAHFSLMLISAGVLSCGPANHYLPGVALDGGKNQTRSIPSTGATSSSSSSASSGASSGVATPPLTGPESANCQTLCQRLVPGDVNHGKMTSAELQVANTAHADFTGADLSGTSIGWHDFRCAKLDGANLRNINWGGANFRCASLRDVVKTGMIGGSIFTDADLTGTQGLP